MPDFGGIHGGERGVVIKRNRSKGNDQIAKNSLYLWFSR
jgi:hypothetical protein